LCDRISPHLPTGREMENFFTKLVFLILFLVTPIHVCSLNIPRIRLEGDIHVRGSKIPRYKSVIHVFFDISTNRMKIR